MASISLTVNGVAHRVDVAPEEPLVWVLREQLGLTGTKLGCGRGICGACTVHLGGTPVRSCQVPATSAQARPIVTIEGLSTHGDHPCQRAWLEEDVAQCGYCQPGMIMKTAALLQGTASPALDEIEAALADHVCRCGTYDRIRRAAHRAAALKAEEPAK
jgi:isoquinoline 1-oxidoreductase alpha subunit